MKIIKDNVEVSRYELIGYDDNREYIKIYLDDPPIKQYIHTPLSNIEIFEDISINTIRTISDIFISVKVSFNINNLMNSDFVFVKSNKWKLDNTINNMLMKQRIADNRQKYEKPFFTACVINSKQLSSCVNYNSIINRKSGIYIDNSIQYPVCIQLSSNDKFTFISIIFKSYENLINTFISKSNVKVI